MNVSIFYCKNKNLRQILQKMTFSGIHKLGHIVNCKINLRLFYLYPFTHPVEIYFYQKTPISPTRHSFKHIYIMNQTQSHIKKSRLQSKSLKGGYFWDLEGIRWASATGVYGHIPSDSCIWQFRVMLQ